MRNNNETVTRNQRKLHGRQRNKTTGVDCPNPAESAVAAGGKAQAERVEPDEAVGVALNADRVR